MYNPVYICWDVLNDVCHYNYLHNYQIFGLNGLVKFISLLNTSQWLNNVVVEGFRHCTSSPLMHTSHDSIALDALNGFMICPWSVPWDQWSQTMSSEIHVIPKHFDNG